jgi:hypothetical protein
MAKTGHIPVPTGPLDATLIEWGKNLTLFRVHPEVYGAVQFNPVNVGSARFSPLLRSNGTVVPTLYAGTTLDCALMETVFHDLPVTSGLKTVVKATHIAGRVRSSIRSKREMSLIDLRSIALHKLGLRRVDLIDTDASEYPITRQWASALYEQFPAAEGMIWTSKQDDDAKAIILFEDRLRGSLDMIASSESLLMPDGSACVEVLDLALRLEANVV